MATRRFIIIGQDERQQCRYCFKFFPPSPDNSPYCSEACKQNAEAERRTAQERFDQETR